MILHGLAYHPISGVGFCLTCDPPLLAAMLTQARWVSGREGE